MFCEAYKQPLTDAAASGEVLQSVLKQHLASCESCRAAFDEEQSLFEAIDSGLRATTNSEVPATLVPHVRTAIAVAPQPRTFSFPLWAFAGAAAATAAIAAFLFAPSRHPSGYTPRVVSSVAPAGTAENSAALLAVNPPEKSGVSPLHHVRSVALRVSNSSSQRFPEVIVAPEEEAAVLRYEEFLRRKPAGVIQISARSLDLSQAIEPLQIAEIELGALSIPTLSKWDSEGDAK